MPTVHAGVVDQFEVDLRSGAFVLRQSDLYLNDVIEVPLTRSYNSRDWMAKNRVHAFGRNSNHPYDIAPLGSRNPYTYQMIALEDGDFIYFDRISKAQGTPMRCFNTPKRAPDSTRLSPVGTGTDDNEACRRV